MHVEVPRELTEFLANLSRYEPVEEELFVRQVFRYGLADLRREYAVKLFAEGRVSLGEGAQLAGLSVGEYMDLLVSRGLQSKVTLEDYWQGLGAAKALLK